jgi:MFS family permease
MDRSLRAVLLGTFTLRFSTGLTSSMLAFYLAHLGEHGGPSVDGFVVGLYAATFYLAELVLSPVFGIISDRYGHHRIMVFGPVFGATAVIITGLAPAFLVFGAAIMLLILGGTRILEGASSAASVPSILGYIAIATAGNEVLRGKTSARFEAATLAGLGLGAIVGVQLFQFFENLGIGPAAFFLNAAFYGVSFLIYMFGVSDPPGEAEARAVLLLAPTWIAINAALGVWLSQSVFQLAKGDPTGRFPNQTLMGGFTANQITIGAIVIAAIFGAGLLYWGNRFKTYRRTTIIGYGVIGGAALVIAGIVVNHFATTQPVLAIAAGIVAAGGLFVLAGATPAAIGLLADMSERFPTDRGAIMGLYSVFLAAGQITGSLIGGIAADWLGIDGMFIATLILIGIATVPLSRLRAQEHTLTDPGPGGLASQAST